ncbi:MAG TPA: DUF1295 domain-containing protein [Pirellulaceae bacterium]|nr:DUF1295 domain-containing protein [Pirellulaceae bacterium]
MFDLWLIVAGWLASSALMVALFWLQKRIGDAGIVDVAWSLGVAAVAVLYAVGGPGLAERKAIVLIVVLVWAVRLAFHVWVRMRRLPHDGRYQALEREWGATADARMFRFYQMQALGIVLFSLPVLFALRNPVPLSGWDWLGLGIGILAIALESHADWQLTQFRRKPSNRGQVCQVGWWRYSRHPNYFFEWLHWWAYVALAITWQPWGWMAIMGPLAMWYFITRVTGIPPTEAQAIRSRGDAYRRYQQSTSPFFPWFSQRAN